MPGKVMGFRGGSAGKESALNAGDLDSMPGLGRSPGGGHGYPLRCSCPESHVDRELGLTKHGCSQRVEPKAQGFCGERQAHCWQWSGEGEEARALLPQTASAPGSCRSQGQGHSAQIFLKTSCHFLHISSGEDTDVSQMTNVLDKRIHSE